MMRRTELPEERLLNLIKRKTAKPPAKNMFMRAPAQKADFLKSLNRYLAVSLGILVCFFIYIVLAPQNHKSDKIPEQGKAAPSIDKNAVINTAAASPKADDYSKYSAIINQKQLFGYSDSAVSQDAIQSQNAADNFNLVGIIPGDTPQAIVEDRTAGKTYYLSKGASINGAVVREISNSKVVLDYNGDTISLVL